MNVVLNNSEGARGSSLSKTGEFIEFVGGLSEEECRSQLVLAYLQMELCQNVLDGEDDVEPVSMMDNGESSDLELFYKCKKAASELSYLNDIVSSGESSDVMEGVEDDGE